MYQLLYLSNLIRWPMKKSIFRFSSIAVLLLLLWNPSLACKGAGNGLMLWAQVVLPTLLPFMVCSNVIVALNAIGLLTRPFRPLLNSFFHLSGAGSYVLVSGLLCGYPMGAKTCNEFLNAGKISTGEARYLLTVCNHPSPMFLLGYVMAMLPAGFSSLLLLLSLYLPIFPVAWIARRWYRAGDGTGEPEEPAHAGWSFDDMLMGSFEVMVKIGGYIMLFSILAAYLTVLPLNSSAVKAVILGFVEITTGIQAISSAIPGEAAALFIVITAAFGGLSGIFQTKSVLIRPQDAKNAGLSIRHYVIWKGIHAALSGILFLLLKNLPLFA